ncbi:unnamed protein product [Chironomus riparius]|uniref:Uncharacterized protein n=1 Tax=Chironomus riparius TaxID=315576 RepID=A0A9N9S099_9DIPT|nr:unnamed protein product [Chironomus riparius]
MIKKNSGCISTKTGCVIIGALYTFAGLSLLYFTLVLLPFTKFVKLAPDELTWYILFLIFVSLYYVWISIAGFLLIYGTFMRQHKKMFSLLLTLFSHSFMIMVCDIFYDYLDYIPINSECWRTHYYCRSQLQVFFQYNFTAIYIIGMFVVGLFAVCIIFEMKNIQNDQNDRNVRIYNEKALLDAEQYSNHV